MPIVLHGDTFSASTRLVMMTLESLRLKYEMKHVDVMKGDNLTTAFQKISPRQSVPTLVDGTFTLSESRAIAMYLVTRYGDVHKKGKGEQLYPVIIQDRAKVDELLFYDATVVTKTFQEFMNIDEAVEGRMMAILHYLNKLLDQSTAGTLANTDHLTIGDLALFAVVSTIQETGAIDLTPYRELTPWLQRCERSVPNYENANGYGVEKVARFYYGRVQAKRSAKSAGWKAL